MGILKWAAVLPCSCDQLENFDLQQTQLRRNRLGSLGNGVVEDAIAFEYLIESNRSRFRNSRKNFFARRCATKATTWNLLGRVQSVEIFVELLLHLLDPVEFNLSLRDFGILITLFQHRNRSGLQSPLLSFAIARKDLTYLVHLRCLRCFPGGYID
jgi:hypothetical protein